MEAADIENRLKLYLLEKLMEVLEARNLKYIYPGCAEPAVDGISFEVPEGELLCICGETGSGKSTLLRLLKKELTMNGTLTGTLEFRDPSVKIGYVGQNPSEQIVTDKVWHELAFGMENLGISREKMALRIAEVSAYFGIEDWFEKNTDELSGGQQQLLNLASVMAMEPEILLLDEPTSRLDPVSADSFLSSVIRLKRDLSLTVIIAEHRLEEVLPACDRLMVMQNGRIKVCDEPRSAVMSVSETEKLYKALPVPYRLFDGLDNLKPAQRPMTVIEARRCLEKAVSKIQGHDDVISQRASSERKNAPKKEENIALEMKNVYFRYTKETPDVLSDFNLKVKENEICCLMGGNGTGKTTAALVAAGLKKPYCGEVRVFGRPIKKYKDQSLYNGCLSMLPQDVEDLFLYDTVREELDSVGYRKNVNPIEIPEQLYERHPYDLSGGERQLLALAKVMQTGPKLLILDEPTKGLDAGIKHDFIKTLFGLKEQGITCLIITHDAEFAAECADRCFMCFRGSVVAEGTPDRFFADNRFYTTASCRIAKGLLEGYPTPEALKEVLKKIIDK